MYRNQWPVNFNLHFGKLQSDNSINDKKLFGNYTPKCYKVKRNLTSFNCCSEYSMLVVTILSLYDIFILIRFIYII